MSEGCSSCSTGNNDKQVPKQAQYLNLLETAKNVIAIASGKGGVGKSTIAVNLAVALAKKGYKTGLLDADIYGPSVSKMFGTGTGQVSVTDEKLNPIEVHGVKTMSIGNLVDPEKATIWRGPLIHSALQQMIKDVNWGDLDYFILDLPPGTGDVQLSLVQSLKVTGVIAVSTPQEVSLIDVKKAIDMFRKVDVNILGIIENMSFFKCDKCGEKHLIFGESAVKKYSQSSGIELLAQIPIEVDMMRSGEESKPFALKEDDKIYSELADKLAGKVK